MQNHHNSEQQQQTFELGGRTDPANLKNISVIGVIVVMSLVHTKVPSRSTS